MSGVGSRTVWLGFGVDFAFDKDESGDGPKGSNHGVCYVMHSLNVGCGSLNWVNTLFSLVMDVHPSSLA